VRVRHAILRFLTNRKSRGRITAPFSIFFIASDRRFCEFCYSHSMKYFFSQRCILIVAVLCFLTTPAFAQAPQPAGTPWKSLLTALSTEDWDTAHQLSKTLLDEIKNEDNEKNLARLRYMFLYSAAGRVLAGKMTYDELEAAVKPFVGKELVVPFRTVREQCGGRNLNLICADNPDKKSLLVPATNQKGTTILIFEYYKFKGNPKLPSLVGSQASLSGTVSSIQPNPNRSNLIIVRVYLADAKVFASKR
jgi:hypothetical protein